MTDTFLDVRPLFGRAARAKPIVWLQPAKPAAVEGAELASESIMQLANRLQEAGPGGVAARAVMVEVRRRQALWEARQTAGWTACLLTGLRNLAHDWEW